MTRQQMKAMAKAQLGNQIFGNTWLIAVGVITIQTAISYFVNAIPVAGQVASLLVMGPIAYGVASMFLKQTRTGEKWISVIFLTASKTIFRTRSLSDL